MATATQDFEYLQERATLGSVRVDRANSVIRGVKILGVESRNGRTYPLSTIQRAAAKYEGARVNVNHPGTPSQSRDYRDRIGHLRNVRVEASGLYGDLHYNPMHPLAEQLAWDAENCPTACGLSHNIRAKTSRGIGGKLVVEEIETVVSVDLVADPATTGGLYESIDDDGADDDVAEEFVEPAEMSVGSFVEAVTGTKSLLPWSKLVAALGLSEADAQYVRSKIAVAHVAGVDLYHVESAREILSRRDREPVRYVGGGTAVEDQPEEVPEAFVRAMSGKQSFTESASTTFVRALK